MDEMWEILVPCKFEDNQKPVRTKHHKQWDKFVRNISGGLTIFTPVKGQWVDNGNLYLDKMIPVRIVCNEKQINKIIDFSLKHYRQLAILAYRISDRVILKKG